MRATATTTCKKCNEAKPSSQIVRIWDGRQFCVECLKRYSPLLFEKSDQLHSLVIRDDYYSVRTIVFKTASYACPGLILFGFVFLVGGVEMWFQGKATLLEALVGGPLVALGLTSIVFVLFTCSNLAFTRNPHSVLRIRGGEVSYRAERVSAIGEWKHLAGPCSDFKFYVTRWPAHPRLPWRTPSLLLQYIGGGILKRYIQVTVMMTQEQYDLWQEIETLDYEFFDHVPLDRGNPPSDDNGDRP